MQMQLIFSHNNNNSALSFSCNFSMSSHKQNEEADCIWRSRKELKVTQMLCFGTFLMATSHY